MERTPCLLGSSGASLREAFGQALVKLADAGDEFVVFDADVAGGTGTHHFREAYPKRFFQFGIAEQNMMAAAGGFASTGITPFVTTFAVFCLRAIEQVRLSIAYSQRDVKIVASHPGLDVGPDGASAQCLEDLAMFRAIPEMVVISPADAQEVEAATKVILDYQGPVYMRTGRSAAPDVYGDGKQSCQFKIGIGDVLIDGDDVTLMACGVEVSRAIHAAQLLNEEGIAARVVNMSTIKPIDVELIKLCVEQTGCIVTAEDHNIIGGFGSAVAEVVVNQSPCPIEFVGVHDVFGESGEPHELADKYGLCANHIVDAARRVVQRKNRF